MQRTRASRPLAFPLSVVVRSGRSPRCLRLIRNAFHLHPLAGGGRTEASNDVSAWIKNGHSSEGRKRLAILRQPPRAVDLVRAQVRVGLGVEAEMHAGDRVEPPLDASPGSVLRRPR